MSRRNRGLSPTLFPFLAVLVCTLGTLILLLALVAQNATANASAKTSAANEPNHAPELSSKQVEQLHREETFKLDALIKIREAQTLDLEKQREQQTHLENHIRRLREKIEQLRKEVEIATTESQNILVSQEELDDLKSRTKELTILKKKLEEEVLDTDPKVVIIPHEGPNGTNRRAIYLECTSDGLVIWPEGSKITLDQLRDSAESANPLDAALRTIRIHALQVYGDEIAPYPLLVVRPDGIETYAAARKAMQTWDDQFGYELIESEKEIAFPTKDPQLLERVEVAIAEAISRQRRIYSATTGRTLANNRMAKRGVQRDNLPTLSAAAMSRSSRAQGYKQLRDDYVDNTKFQPTPTRPYEDRSRESGFLDPYQRSSNVPTSTSMASEPPSDDSADQKSLLGRARIPSQPSYTTPQRSNHQTKGNPSFDRTDGIHEHNSISSETSMNNIGQQALAVRTEAGRSQTDKTNSESADVTGNGIEQGIDDRSGQQLDGGLSNPGPSAQNSSAPYSSPPPSQSSKNNDTLSQNTVSTIPFSNQQVSDKPSGSTASMGSEILLPQQEEDLRLDESVVPPLTPNDSQRLTPTELQKIKPLLKKSGNHWAIPRSILAMRGNAIVRTLRVELHSDRLVLLPSREAASIEIFSFFDGNLERAALQLATAIHDRIEQWGPALPGGKWQPSVEVILHSATMKSFDLLEYHFRGSGLPLKRGEMK